MGPEYTRNYISARSVVSNSLNTNEEYWEALKRYPAYKSPEAFGFSWVSNNQTLREIVQKHFPSVLNTFHVMDEPNLNTKGSIVEVVSIDQTVYNSGNFLQQSPHESICVGGPSALVMAYFEAERFSNKNTSKQPLYLRHNQSLIQTPMEVRYKYIKDMLNEWPTRTLNMRDGICLK